MLLAILGLTEFLYIGGGLLVGVFVGYLARSSQEKPKRMRIAETYERRTRLAEQDQEAAIRQLNANQIEMRRVESTFEDLETQIRNQESGVRSAREESAAAKKEMLRQADELETFKRQQAGIETANGELAKKTKQALQVAERESKRSSEFELANAQAMTRIEALVEEAGRTSERITALSTRAEESDRLEGSLGEVRAVLAERENSLVASDARMLELTRRVDSLGVLEPELAQRIAELAQQTTRAEEFERRVESLAPLEAELEEVRARLAAREDEWRTADETVRAKLELVQGELKGAVQRIVDLEPFEGQLEELRAGFSSREDEWRTADAAAKESAGDSKRSLEEARERILALEPLQGDLDQRQRRYQERELEWTEKHASTLERVESAEAGLAESKDRADELARSVAALTAQQTRSEKEQDALEVKLEQRDQEVEELREARAEAKRLTVEFERSRKSESGLEGRLERERDRSESVSEKLQTLREADLARRAELDEWKTRFGKLSGEFKTTQLKIDRLAKRNAELEAASTERKAKVRELTHDLRDSATEVRVLEGKLAKGAVLNAARASRSVAGNAPAKAATASSARAQRDELEELTGVGPALAKKLQRVGFKTFESIARLDRDGLEALAEKVGLSAANMRRNKWTTSARRLHRAKYGTSVKV